MAVEIVSGDIETLARTVLALYALDAAKINVANGDKAVMRGHREQRAEQFGFGDLLASGRRCFTHVSRIAEWTRIVNRFFRFSVCGNSSSCLG